MFSKRTMAALALAALAAAGAWAQQITRVAVVDLPKVYATFFRDSKAVRDFEERGARVKAEIERMTAEIQTLQRSKVDAAAAGDQEKALRLEAEAARKDSFLREYYRVKTAELEDQRKKLSQSDAFLSQVLAAIGKVAEAEGFSVVLKLSDAAGVVWYSPTVDISDKVVQALLAEAGR